MQEVLLKCLYGDDAGWHAIKILMIIEDINECKEYCTGIKVNGMRIQMLRFADYNYSTRRNKFKKSIRMPR
jgi:hypothetical protein